MATQGKSPSEVTKISVQSVEELLLRIGFTKKLGTYDNKWVIDRQGQETLINLSVGGTFGNYLWTNDAKEIADILLGILRPQRLEIEKEIQTQEKVVLLDNDVIGRLCATSKEANKNWTELLNEVLKSEKASKIIIPDYIADFELRGIARIYDNDDNPLETGSLIPACSRTQIANDFLKKAVRRHENKDGKIEYLADAGLRREEINDNIIIWETSYGKDKEQQIFNFYKHGSIDKIKKDFWAKKVGHGAKLSNNFGEDSIDEVARVLPQGVKITIVSNDVDYLEKKSAPPDQKRLNLLDWLNDLGNPWVCENFSLGTKESEQIYDTILTDGGDNYSNIPQSRRRS